LKTTEILKNEHQIILKKIEESLSLLDGPDWKSIAYWDSFLLFLQKFADDYHHAKEEDIYFAWMREKQPMLDQGPLHCMLSEHDTSREIVGQAKEKLEEIRSGDESSWDSLKSLIREYSQILRDHISKEDNILYNMAEELDSNTHDGDDVMMPGFEQVKERLESSILNLI
jgi:hemerythrin-like domain-containing protein